jgi:hypothetical protein
MIGRQDESQILRGCLESGESQFVAITGRRRVGKTYLVREVLGEQFAFHATGLQKADLEGQLASFTDALRRYGGDSAASPATWFDAFAMLRDLLETKDSSKKVVFLDEMPWMDTPKSGFLTALEWFWNSWAAWTHDIVLVACGSAASWIVTKLYRNTGGLYNRVTRRIWLQPFTLAECAEYCEQSGVKMSTMEMLECYMIFGGVPFYWDLLDKRYSLAQNVGRLCFADGGQLRHEFDSLYSSLFNHSERHVEVVRALGSKGKGLAREELVDIVPMVDGGTLNKTLKELEQSGFIRKYRPFGRRSRGSLIQLVDAFTLFHLRFIENSPTDTDYWLKQLPTGRHSAWTGVAFERVCLQHLPQLKVALGISGILASPSSWQSRSRDAQIDLVIDRSDKVINLCEMKYASGEFRIDKALDEALRRRRETFRDETKTHKALHITMVTPFGVAHNEYWGGIQSEVTAEALFAE